MVSFSQYQQTGLWNRIHLFVASKKCTSPPTIDTVSLRKVHLSDFNSQEAKRKVASCASDVHSCWVAWTLDSSQPWPESLASNGSSKPPERRFSAPCHFAWRLNYMQSPLLHCQDVLAELLTPRVNCQLEKGASGKPNGLVIIPTHPSVSILFILLSDAQSAHTWYHCLRNNHSSNIVLSLAASEWDQMKMVIYF